MSSSEWLFSTVGATVAELSESDQRETKSSVSLFHPEPPPATLPLSRAPAPTDVTHLHD